MLERILRALYMPVWRMYWDSPSGSFKEKLMNRILDKLDWMRDYILFV